MLTIAKQQTSMKGDNSRNGYKAGLPTSRVFIKSDYYPFVPLSYSFPPSHSTLISFFLPHPLTGTPNLPTQTLQVGV